MWFDLMKDQEVEMNPSLPDLYQELEMVGCNNKDYLSPLSRVLG